MHPRRPLEKPQRELRLSWHGNLSCSRSTSLGFFIDIRLHNSGTIHTDVFEALRFFSPFVCIYITLFVSRKN